MLFRPRAGPIELVGSRSVLAPTLKRYAGVWFGWSGTWFHALRSTTKTIANPTSLYVDHYRKRTIKNTTAGLPTVFVADPALPHRPCRVQRRDLTGYLRLEPAFCRRTFQVILPSDLIWVHDYHFIPLGEELRNVVTAIALGFLLRSVPAPEFITVLPRHERILSSLLQYDLVAISDGGRRSKLVRYVLSENRGSNIRSLAARIRRSNRSQSG